MGQPLPTGSGPAIMAKTSKTKKSAKRRDVVAAAVGSMRALTGDDGPTKKAKGKKKR
jgi:hypothetical protein